MASQNQRNEEGVVLTEQPDVCGQTEDGTVAFNPPTHKEPRVMDVDIHV